MAGRKKKRGLEYWSEDCSMFRDRKIRRLIRKYSGDGYMIYQYIKSNIYEEHGYYIDYDEDFLFDLSDALKIGDTVVEDIIAYCIDIELFDKVQFDQNSILTSRGIQSRYMDACRVMRRTDCDIDDRYNVIDVSMSPEEIHSNDQIDDSQVISSEEIAIITEEIHEQTHFFCNNTEEIPQTKLNQTKLKETKLNQTKQKKGRDNFLKKEPKEFFDFDAKSQIAQNVVNHYNDLRGTTYTAADFRIQKLIFGLIDLHHTESQMLDVITARHHMTKLKNGRGDPLWKDEWMGFSTLFDPDKFLKYSQEAQLLRNGTKHSFDGESTKSRNERAIKNGSVSVKIAGVEITG